MKALSKIKCGCTQEVFILFLGGHTGKEIAHKYGLTERRINRVINRELDRLAGFFRR